jgi:uncharacterized alpha-E superfamily protein
MLSRIAESLFWIGRYVERADDTARLLQTHLRLLAEDTSAAEVDSCRNLLALMSIDKVEQPTPDDLLRLLAYDGTEASSIYASCAAARDNARRAREVIPGELWECINSTWHQLPGEPFGVARAYTFLDWTRERSAIFTGIARVTMVRDEGWQFLLLGRSLEQFDMTSRMVASASLTGGGSRWPAVLRGCGGHDAFLRTYGGLYSEPDAARFMVIDSRFPRSVLHGIIAATDCLLNVSRANPSAVVSSATALRALGQLKARLEFADMEALLANLQEEMAAVQDVSADVTRTVSDSFFAATGPTAWTTEGTR